MPAVRTRWRLAAALLAAALTLSACGGGGSSAPAPVTYVPSGPGSPTAVNNTATDGFAWINYRRGQAGLPQLARNALLDKAAQAHSEYLRANNVVQHEETPGKTGYTGATLTDRINAANYTLSNYAVGEVISATSSNSGFYMAEELITAIYHRFVMFEPKFKEIGTGAATNGSGYSYFTADFAANNGYGDGLGLTGLVTWPFNGQTGVPANFLSNYESPDPVPNLNEVGYPISVHADLNVELKVTSFTVRQRGASTDLPVRLLTHAADEETPEHAAAIIPLAALKSGTTYDVTFSGATGESGNVPVTRTWSFTTR
ncbi:CAP domain-containing protein [Massilia arenosa]|uniref:CAP domain-containing protein n=1 Tax=Zemynaea arenosa TaxID=2561931 RepID=A0A4Y9SFV6_9BURK|nr:CAP domain-containing protein [Massilia arenosa]TFW22599.1 CAP domain-containing protein [Massilia arenosa]